MSFNNLFTLAIIVIIMLAPLTSTYLRDKNFLNKVGSLGIELEKN